MPVANLNALAKQAADAVDEQFVVTLTQALVRIRSVYDPEAGTTERDAALHVAKVLQELGLNPVVEDAAPGRPNVICDWQGSNFDPAKHKTLMFEGHTDVVTEGNPDTWQDDPYAAIIKDGKLYGRGSCDMKGGVAAAIAATKALMSVAPDLPGRIRLGIVADEEGMMLGIKHFIRQGWANDIDAAIICEPEELELCLFQKGALRVLVTATGVMSHGAMPYAGVNPIRALTQFVEAVAAYEQAEQARLGAHEHLGLPWLTPTIFEAPVQGEAQHNVMPEQARVAFDIRTVPGQDHDAILAKLNQIARELEASTPRLTLDVNCFESRPWTQTPADDPVVKALEDSYPLILNKAPVYGGVPGATDGTFLRSQANVPIVTVGPGERELPHQRNEYVETRDLVQAARLYAAASVFFLNDV